MLKYCLEKWDKNNPKLKKKLKTTVGLNECHYKDLVKMVVETILNDDNKDYTFDHWDSNDIIEIDHGHYQGTLLYLIHKDFYEPCENDYLMTYVNYGSCSGCDTLQHIQDWDENALLTELQVKDFMTLCKDIVTNIICPYNIGWRGDPIYETVEA